MQRMLPIPARWLALACLILTAYLALGLNAPTAWQRWMRWSDSPLWMTAALTLLELLLVAMATGMFLLACAALSRRLLQLVGAGLLIFSALAVWFMVRHQTQIGYATVSAVLSPDQGFAHEILEPGLWVWLVLAGVLPALLWVHLLRRLPVAGPRGLLAWPARLALLGLSLLALLLVLLMARGMKQIYPQSGTGLSPSGVAAHRYVPTNWVYGLGAHVAVSAHEAVRGQLPSPVQRHVYEPGQLPQDFTLVLVVGESLRSDHLQVLGAGRETTPRLAAEPGLVAFHGWSCDTSTRHALACMFVRPEALEPSDGWSPDRVREGPVFDVFDHLGFDIELYAMQAEAGFYRQTRASHFRLREEVAAGRPEGQPLDEWLLPPVQKKLARTPGGRQLIVLHKKGSHFHYSARYPRSFARWQPECLDVQHNCSEAELRNSYDNSILYSDHVLAELMNLLRDRPALLVVTADHGQSISATARFHGTPRAIAPPEQRRVPLLFWASPPLRAQAPFAARMQALRHRATASADTPVDHGHLFASLLGCSGIVSADGGITPEHNLCQLP